MAFKLPTMSRETSSSTSTGDMVMAGAQTGYFAFSAGLSNGDTTFLTFKMGSDTEEGLYTYNSGANSFTRTQIYRSTNGNAAVSWSAGTKDVICGLVGPSNLDAAGLALLRVILGVGFYDAAMALSEAQMAQARSNVYAAPFDAMGYFGLQINGGMEISQKNGTGAVAALANAAYPVDGVQYLKNGTMVVTAQQVTDAPPGFANSLKISVTTAESSIGVNDHATLSIPIEGFDVESLQLGTAGAQSVTFAFYVKAHRAGAYSGTARNSAVSRCYPFSFTINSADTWEYKTVTIPGDTSGTWLLGNNVGISLTLCIAGGTNLLSTANAWATAGLVGVTGTTNGVAATSDVFQVTGAFIVPGTEAPSAARLPFIMRKKSQEILRCERYYQKSHAIDVTPSTAPAGGAGFCAEFITADGNGSVIGKNVNLHSRMRAVLTSGDISFFDGVGASGVAGFNVTWSGGLTPTVNSLTDTSFSLFLTGGYKGLNFDWAVTKQF